MIYKEVSSCRACGAELKNVLDLGRHAISDFATGGTLDDFAPLVLAECQDCRLVQLRHTVDRTRLYRRYWYRSGTNESMVASLRNIVIHALAQVDLKPGDKVLDIGCNDGTMLRMFPDWLDRHGYEPSQLAQECTGDITVIRDYWPPTLPREPFHFYKIITTIAMFYDVEDLDAFVRNVGGHLHPDGVWIIQMATLPQMVNHNAFDNICHEHLCYWHSHALERLLAKYGLVITESSFNDVNGGNMRFVVRHGLPNPFFRKDLGGGALLGEFTARVTHLKAKTMTLLEDIAMKGEFICGYGASTKGNTLLQYYGIDANLLPIIADRNPEKVGCTTPGSYIPIISEDTMREFKPDYLFVLPWHFLDSFIVREQKLLRQGTRFIVPLPTLRVLGVEDACVQSVLSQTATRATVVA